MTHQSPHFADKNLLNFVNKQLPSDYRITSIAAYDFSDGSNCFYVIRADSHCRQHKWIRPVYHDGNKYVLKKPEKPKDGYPLFKRYTHNSEYILVVEGEKCVEIAAAFGLSSVTSGSSGSALSANWEFLQGKKVLIWPDFDEPGVQYAMSVYKIIKDICEDVKVIDVAKLNLPVGGDIEQYLDQNPLGTCETISSLPTLPNILPLKLPDATSNNDNDEFPVHYLPKDLERAASDIANEKQVTLAMASFGMIAALSHIGMTRVNVRRPNMPKSDPGIPTGLFLIILGGSGEGKSESLKDALKVVLKHEKANIDRAKRKIGELKEALKGASVEEQMGIKAEIDSIKIPQRIFDDVTYEPLVSRFLDDMPFASLISDEGGQFLGGHSMKADTFRNTLGGLTKLWDNGQVSRLRSKSNSEGSGIAFNKRLMFYLMAQPIIVQEALNNPLLVGQGFLARFLFSAPKSLVGTRKIDIDMIFERRRSGDYERAQMQAFWKRCDEILASDMYVNKLNENMPPALELNDHAMIFWADSWNELEQLTAPNAKYHCIKEIANRVSDNALRLSALFALYKGQKVIDLDTYRSAYGICRYSLDQWLKYFSNYSSEGSKSRHRSIPPLEVANWLIAKNRAEQWSGFTATRFSTSGPNKYRAAETRDQILKVLVEYNYLFTSDWKTFIVNPNWQGQEL